LPVHQHTPQAATDFPTFSAVSKARVFRPSHRLNARMNAISGRGSHNIRPAPQHNLLQFHKRMPESPRETFTKPYNLPRSLSPATTPRIMQEKMPRIARNRRHASFWMTAFLNQRHRTQTQKSRAGVSSGPARISANPASSLNHPIRR
jgi:hypothetical protein